jgi:nucleoside-diphosphate-sugar epimerase
MKNVLITGGAGYVGTSLIEELNNNHTVGNIIIVDNLINSNNLIVKNITEIKKLKFYNLDVRDLSKINNLLTSESITHVVHLAGIVGDPACKIESNDPIVVNLDSSKELFKICQNKKIKKFIFSSTCSNYGIVNPNQLADEKTTLKPLSIYAQTKVDFENFIINQNNKSEMTSIIFRFATVFGLSPRMRFDLTVNQFVRDVFFKNNLEVFAENTWRPYCHVRDVARCINLNLDNEESLSIYNVGNSNQNYSKKHIVEAISKFLDTSCVKYLIKGDFDKRDYKVSFDKIHKDKNFRTSYDLNYGIKETIDYLNNNNKEDFYSNIYSNT